MEAFHRAPQVKTSSGEGANALARGKARTFYFGAATVLRWLAVPTSPHVPLVGAVRLSIDVARRRTALIEQVLQTIKLFVDRHAHGGALATLIPGFREVHLKRRSGQNKLLEGEVIPEQEMQTIASRRAVALQTM